MANVTNLAMDKDKTFWRGLGMVHPFDDDTAIYFKEYGFGNGMELSNEDDSWKGFICADGCGKADGMDFKNDLI